MVPGMYLTVSISGLMVSSLRMDFLSISSQRNMTLLFEFASLVHSLGRALITFWYCGRLRMRTRMSNLKAFLIADSRIWGILVALFFVSLKMMLPELM